MRYLFYESKGFYLTNIMKGTCGGSRGFWVVCIVQNNDEWGDDLSVINELLLGRLSLRKLVQRLWGLLHHYRIRIF